MGGTQGSLISNPGTSLCYPNPIGNPPPGDRNPPPNSPPRDSPNQNNRSS